ncbi:MAG: YgaP family membrane protein [Bacillota bacterium]
MADKTLYLKKNVGTVDKVIRMVLGAGLITLPALLGSSAWTIAILAAFGGSLILESIIAY